MAPLARALGVMASAERLLLNPLFRWHASGPNAGDPLYALRHQQHLVRDLSMAERLACTIDHYEFDDAHCDRAYQHEVYRGRGVELWSADVSGRRYAIVLRDSDRHRHEGALSVALMQGDNTLHVLSFSWIRPGSLGLASPQAWTMLITRNQSSRVGFEPMRLFKKDFPQNATGYFCLSAALGLAEAHGHRVVAAVGHAQQIAFKSEFEAGFRHSYCDFWSLHGGVGDSHRFWSIPVMVPRMPLDQLPQKHRTRAQARRGHWTEIRNSALGKIGPHVVANPPVPAHPSRVAETVHRPRFQRATVATWLATMMDFAPTLPL